MQQVRGRRNGEAGEKRMFLRVSQYVLPGRTFNDAGILHSSRVLPPTLRVVIWVEDRRGVFLKMDTIITAGQPKARVVPADFHLATIIFGSIDQADFSVFHDGSRIKHVQRFPVHTRV